MKEIDRDVTNAMLTLWHEIDSQEGADAWSIVKEFVDKHNKTVYAQFTIEDFIFGDDDFISESIPNKILKYVNDNDLPIDVTVLEHCISCRRRMNEIAEEISQMSYAVGYGYEEFDQDRETELLLEEETLYPYVEYALNLEIRYIKKLIKSLIN